MCTVHATTVGGEQYLVWYVCDYVCVCTRAYVEGGEWGDGCAPVSVLCITSVYSICQCTVVVVVVVVVVSGCGGRDLQGIMLCLCCVPFKSHPHFLPGHMRLLQLTAQTNPTWLSASDWEVRSLLPCVLVCW